MKSGNCLHHRSYTCRQTRSFSYMCCGWISFTRKDHGVNLKAVIHHDKTKHQNQMRKVWWIKQVILDMIAKMQLLFNAKLPNEMNIERKQYKSQLVKQLGEVPASLILLSNGSLNSWNSIHEFCPEKNISIVEHAFFQRNHYKLIQCDKQEEV